jgi:hypothetical protein
LEEVVAKDSDVSDFPVLAIANSWQHEKANNRKSRSPTDSNVSPLVEGEETAQICGLSFS